MKRRHALVAAVIALLTTAPVAIASHSQESVFQDDQYLVDSPPATVAGALRIMHSLGVERIRVNVEWAQIAPNPLSTVRPQGFNATDPAAYPASGWAPYDRLVELAEAAGMGIEFNITAPGPLWAMGKRPPTARAANHWRPNPTEFYWFVYALGVRYSGTYGSVPRVDTWSIWNEPDQPGWLGPQSAKYHGHYLPTAPVLYRRLLDAAWIALYFSGHGPSTDTVLIGELAPEGYEAPGFYTAMTPVPFLRALYCVDRRFRPLAGKAATQLGCPTKHPARMFAADHPGLFHATGFAHHPYYFFHSPTYGSPDPNFIPLANIGRLERFLDRTFRTYRVKRRLPIYITEYGYQTNPPDVFQLVSPAKQAAYLNEADYMAWRNPRIRSVSQFLLFDAAPDSRYTPSDFGYWDTFQTGILFQDGSPKPAFYAYRMPIWIPHTKVRRGHRLFVWGQVRPADRLGPQTVGVEWRPTHGSYRTIAYAHTVSDTGYVTANVKLPGSGAVKLVWLSQPPYYMVTTSRGVVVR